MADASALNLSSNPVNNGMVDETLLPPNSAPAEHMTDMSARRPNSKKHLKGVDYDNSKNAGT